MKIIIALLIIIGFVSISTAQRNMNPRNGKGKKDLFGGAADYNEYKPYGLQISVGPTFLIPRSHPVTMLYQPIGRTYELTTTPKGFPGIFAEVGMLHFPKRSKLSKALKYVFVSYIDWGLGLKMYNGRESTLVNQLDPVTLNVIGSTEHTGDFSNLFGTARVTLHKNIYLGKKYFIDNGLGINVDYRFSSKVTQGYTDAVHQAIPDLHYFHHPLVAHVHYELGFGIRLNRRSMLIPSVQAPIFGLHEWRGGGTALKWFDSNYYPVIAKIKWTYLFKKNAKGCPPAQVNDQDKDTMRNH